MKISSLIYSSETWAVNLPRELESLYRMGIKTTLAVRMNTCNEIVYIESGTYPAICIIKKRQIKSWDTLNKNLNNEGSLYKLIM